MPPRHHLVSALLAGLVLASCQAPADRAVGDGGPSRRPNVLFIVVDDLTTDLGTYGDAQVKTPNFDRLAARGARFDRAYAQFPLCHPSRTSLLSGRYPEATGVFDNETDPRVLLGAVPFLPEHFRQHGYRTARFGKIVHTQYAKSVEWGEPVDASDSLVAAAQRAASEPPSVREIPPAPGLRRLDGERRAVGWQAVEDDDAALPDGRIARRAVAWLEANDLHHTRQATKAAQGEPATDAEPFFLAVGFNKPHPPFVAPRTYFDLYDSTALVLDESGELPRDLPPAGLDFALLDSGMNDGQRRRAMAAYYACVSFVDAQVGLLLDALDRLHLWDQTIVVLLSDHGMHLGEHGGLWRKLTLFEEALRVPLLIAAPGGRPGEEVTARVELVDLYPTLSELAGLSPPPGLQGRSLAALLRDPHDPKAPGHADAYSVLGLQAGALGRTIRTERYRYVAWPDGTEELWDFRVDPDLRRNLASAPEYRRQLEALRAVLEARTRSIAPPTTQSSM